MTKREEHVVKQMAELVRELFEAGLEEGRHGEFLSEVMACEMEDEETGEKFDPITKEELAGIVDTVCDNVEVFAEIVMPMCMEYVAMSCGEMVEILNEEEGDK